MPLPAARKWIAKNVLLLCVVTGLVVWNSLDLRDDRTAQIETACAAANRAIEATRNSWIVLAQAADEGDRTPEEQARADRILSKILSTLEPADC